MDAYLQPYWCWLVSKTPLWVAPNALTIVGLLINIITSLLLLYHAPDAKADAPRFCYLWCAVGLFLYQSLDAIGEFSNQLNYLDFRIVHELNLASFIFINNMIRKENKNR